MKHEALPNWYRVGVKALILQQGKILFVKEGSNLWDLPGGGIEHQETILEALSREVQEELGVALADEPDVPTFVWKTYDVVNKRPIIVLVYKTKLLSTKFTVTNPVVDIQFLQLRALTEKEVEPYLRRFLSYLQKI